MDACCTESKEGEAIGPFQWNAGGWFGSQIGSTGWMLGGLYYFWSDPPLAIISALCFLAANVVGLILWSLRSRITAYRAIQILLAVVGLCTAIYFVALDLLGRANALNSRHSLYWYLLLFPGLMWMFYLRQRQFPSHTGSWAQADVVREYCWSDPEAIGGNPVLADEAGKGPCLLVESPGPAGRTAPLLIIDNPPVTDSCYAITGAVRYEGVEGSGYLEMWNEFAGGRRFFSRTLLGSGAMGKITGSSPWRTFRLPFYGRRGDRPQRLEINLVLPGRGRVWISPVKLVQPSNSKDSATSGLHPSQ